MPQLANGEGGAKTVCVMDASGPLGHALVDELLRRGYAVNAAAKDYAALCGVKKKRWGESRRLQLFRSDPFDYQSIVDAMKGCSGLFYMFEGSEDQSSYDELMVEMEVRAAHNVLEACAQTDAMERVVFTSSVTAVVWKEDRKALAAVDEKDWSELAFCRQCKLWHALAKTLSERTAWALAMDRGVDMVSINAGLVTVPGLSPAHPYLRGAPDMYDDGVLVTVDVDFLVAAHLAVYESPTAYGRYLCFNHAVCRPEDAVKLAEVLSPSAPQPPASDELRVTAQRIQNDKLKKVMTAFAAGRHEELDGQ